MRDRRRGVLPRRRRDHGQPDRHHPRHRRPPRARRVRTRSGDDRRRGAARRQRHPARRRRPRQDGRGVEPVPRDVRRGLVGPPSRDDGRVAARPLRQPELRLHRRPCAPEGAAARHPRRARQHGAERHQLLDPQPLAQGVRGAGRRRVRHRLRPRRRARRLGARAPRAPARRHQPRRARLRRSRPPHAAASACTPASPSTTWSPRPASSSPSTTDVPETRAPTAEELEVMARLDPRGLRTQEVPA